MYFSLATEQKRWVKAAEGELDGVSLEFTNGRDDEACN
jgi:hypothetical protein